MAKPLNLGDLGDLEGMNPKVREQLASQLGPRQGAPGFNMGDAPKAGPSSDYHRGNPAPPAGRSWWQSGPARRVGRDERLGALGGLIGATPQQAAQGASAAAWATTPSKSAGHLTKMEQRLSAEGMDTLYARGGAVTSLPIKSSNFHIQPGGDAFARNQHLVSNKVDPTIPQEGMTPMAAPSPYREARSPAYPTMGQQQPVVDMRGPVGAADFLHRQTTAGAGGNMWLGADPQHATLTMGLEAPPVRPIRRTDS